ncbi:putative ribonuclease H protein [Sesbania bispinosa]|nr:putative ribonuclease H protein [Sesbania bispinosa]
MVGRITLAQSAVMNIPNYLMQASVILVGNKIHQPKNLGGLGFKSLGLVNEAYMVKLGWRMVSQPNLLWVQAIRAKYKCGNNRMPLIRSCYRESYLWKGISNAWTHVQDSVIWNIGNGKNMRFWVDAFIPGLNPLINYASHPVGDLQDLLPIAAFADDGNWKIEELQTFLPAEIIARLHAVSPPRDYLEDDTLAWANTSDGDFQMKSIYDKIVPQYIFYLDLDLCQAVWSWKEAPRIQCFL